MPTNEFFTLNILVGNQRIPEYSSDGFIYVESNLLTPVSYFQKVSEVVNGETETQNIPVTPYTLQLVAGNIRLPNKYSYYFRVTVDGAKVKGVSLDIGQSKVIRGFRDGAVVRELLFSMPRNSKNKDEKLEPDKVIHVGKIEVECWKATKLSRSWELRQTHLNFTQASKQDSLVVTKGLYTMATSKAGKELYKRRIFRNVDSWRRVELLSKQTIQYHMGHTLEAKGLTLIPYPIMNPHLQQQQPLPLMTSSPTASTSATHQGPTTTTTEAKVKDNDNQNDDDDAQPSTSYHTRKRGRQSNAKEMSLKRTRRNSRKSVEIKQEKTEIKEDIMNDQINDDDDIEVIMIKPPSDSIDLT